MRFLLFQRGEVMGKRRKERWLKRISVVLLAALVSIAPGKVYRAEAANLISPDVNHGYIWNGGFVLSEYVFSEEGTLTLTNTYHYVSGSIYPRGCRLDQQENDSSATVRCKSL